MYRGSCFLASTGLYGLLAATVLIGLERRHSQNEWQRAKVLDTAFNTINFVNAVAATILSSWVLISLDASERTNVTGGRPSELARWTVESVCGYIVAELLLLAVSSRRLSKQFWDWAKESYKWMVIFHIVALTGLLSVLLRDVGYPLAMWVIWSELTSVFLGVESFLEDSRLHLRYARVYRTVEGSSTILFVFQRVFVFLFLLWLCWAQFTWEMAFILQLAILVVGTILNISLSADRVAEMKWC